MVEGGSTKSTGSRGPFKNGGALPLSEADIRTADATRQNWSEINPSIMGTLFERGLDPSKRSQLGAHYTDADKISDHPPNRRRLSIT